MERLRRRLFTGLKVVPPNTASPRTLSRLPLHLGVRHAESGDGRHSVRKGAGGAGETEPTRRRVAAGRDGAWVAVPPCGHTPHGSSSGGAAPRVSGSARLRLCDQSLRYRVDAVRAALPCAGDRADRPARRVHGRGSRSGDQGQKGADRADCSVEGSPRGVHSSRWRAGRTDGVRQRRAHAAKSEARPPTSAPKLTRREGPRGGGGAIATGTDAGPPSLGRERPTEGWDR